MESVSAGVKRWAKEQGLDDLKVLKPLSISIADNIEAWGDGLNARMWGQHFVNNAFQSMPVGFLTILFEDDWPQPINVRRCVNSLERLQKGAGSAVLHAISQTHGVEVKTPFWGFWHIGERDYGDEEENEDSGFLTPLKFEAQIPEPVYDPRWNLRVVWAAIWACERDNKPKKLAEILRLAIELSEIYEKIRSLKIWMDHSHTVEVEGSGFQMSQTTVAFVTWQPENCPMIECMDELQNYGYETGEFTGVAWCHGFQLCLSDDRMETGAEAADRDGSLGAAITAFKLAVRTTVLLDRILFLMKDPSPMKNTRLVPHLRCKSYEELLDERNLTRARLRVRV